MSMVVDPPVQRRRRRWPIVLGVLFALAVLLGVGGVWAGEAYARPAAERQIADSLVRQYHLVARPVVKLRGFPFLIAAARGRLDGANIAVGPSTFEGLRVDNVNLHVGRIDFSPRDVLNGGPVTIAGGEGTAVVNGQAVSAYVRSLGYPLDVTISPGHVTVTGSVEVAGYSAQVSATGALALNGSSLTFSPTSVDLGALQRFSQAVDLATQRLAFTVRLPDLVGLRLRSMTLQDGAVAITADVNPQTLST